MGLMCMGKINRVSCVFLVYINIVHGKSQPKTIPITSIVCKFFDYGNPEISFGNSEISFLPFIEDFLMKKAAIPASTKPAEPHASQLQSLSLDQMSQFPNQCR